MKIGDTFRYINSEVTIIKITSHTATFTNGYAVWRFSLGRTQREIDRSKQNNR